MHSCSDKCPWISPRDLKNVATLKDLERVVHAVVENSPPQFKVPAHVTHSTPSDTGWIGGSGPPLDAGTCGLTWLYSRTDLSGGG